MPVSIYAIAIVFAACLVATVLLTPGVMRFARLVGAVDRGGYRKIFEGAMPLLGGLGVAIPFIFGSLACSVLGFIVIANWSTFFSAYPDHFNTLMTLAGYREDLIAIAIGGLAILAVGIVDDTRGLRPRYKLLGQAGVGLIVCTSGHVFTTLDVPLLGVIDLGPTFGPLFTMLWVVGLINAFNLVDGMDGLASGIAFIAALALLALSIIQGNILVAFASAALAGSLLGFLYFNFHPARIFLGDTGSMFLGYTLAAMSLVGAQKAETAAILVAPLLALGLPVFETFVSIIRRYIAGVPLFAGDNRHTHHRLLLKGFSQSVAVLILCGAELFLAAAAVLSALIPNGSPLGFLPFVMYGVTLGTLLWLAEYGRPQTLKAISHRRQRNRIFQTFGRYASLRLNDPAAHVDTPNILALARQELGLRQLEIVFIDGNRWLSVDPSFEGMGTSAARERLRVKSSTEEDILLWYTFIAEPDENLRQDVSACLAAIFNGLKVPGTTGKEAAPAKRPLSEILPLPTKPQT